MKPIKKTIFVVNVDNYAPNITALTYPFIKMYAKKIGADFQIISERKFPDMPPVYEKMQIRELGKDNDWNIYIDSDALVHPETPDFTEQLHKDTVAHFNNDVASLRFRYDEYFLRDGRNIGSGNWFTIASDWCLDLWHPTELSREEIVSRITPTQPEREHGIRADHLIDDFVLSRNIARFGLKFKKVKDIIKSMGLEEAGFFYHNYYLGNQSKVDILKDTIIRWGLQDYLVSSDK